MRLVRSCPRRPSSRSALLRCQLAAARMRAALGSAAAGAQFARGLLGPRRGAEPVERAGARHAGAGARRRAGRRVGAARPSTAPCGRARTATAAHRRADAPRRRSRPPSAAARAVRGSARRRRAPKGGRSAGLRLRTRPACASARLPGRRGSGTRSGRASTARSWARRSRPRSASSRVRVKWTIAASGRSRPSSSSPRLASACSSNARLPLPRRSSTRCRRRRVRRRRRRSTASSSSSTVCPKCRNWSASSASRSASSAWAARADPVADAELELAEGAQREWQAADEASRSRAIATARSSSRRAVS